jgi:hypothetical protein
MLETVYYYSCPICGKVLSGDEWHDHQAEYQSNALIMGKDYQCPGCNAGLNEDELYEV